MDARSHNHRELLLPKPTARPYGLPHRIALTYKVWPKDRATGCAGEDKRWSVDLVDHFLQSDLFAARRIIDARQVDPSAANSQAQGAKSSPVFEKREQDPTRPRVEREIFGSCQNSQASEAGFGIACHCCRVRTAGEARLEPCAALGNKPLHHSPVYPDHPCSVGPWLLRVV